MKRDFFGRPINDNSNSITENAIIFGRIQQIDTSSEHIPMSVSNTVNTNVNGNTMGQLLNYLYDRALAGVPKLESVEELADSYMSKGGDLEEQIDSLIRWQKRKCGLSGFITGLPGITTAWAMIPANITSVLYMQIRMIAAIAYMCGNDLRDDRIKTMVLACLLGDSVKNVVQEAGVQVAERVSINVIKAMPRSVILAINKAVGFKLVTKFGEKGIINMGKLVPVVGGIIGALLDIFSTDKIG